MIGTNPEKRSKTLLEKIKNVLNVWNNEMNEVDPDVPYFAFFNGGTYVPYRSIRR